MKNLSEDLEVLIIAFLVVVFLSSLFFYWGIKNLDINYEKGLDHGLEVGYDNGYYDGYNKGYSEGFYDSEEGRGYRN